MSPGYLGR